MSRPAPSPLLTRRRLIQGGAGLAAASLAGCELKGSQGAFTVLAGPPGDGKLVRVFWRAAPGGAPDAPVLILLHGQGRNPQDYLAAMAPHAHRHGAALLAPEFDEANFPDSEAYNLGDVFDEAGRRRPPTAWSFAVIDKAFDAFVERSGSKQARYSLFGHSAGAQFVHRFMLFMPATRVERAVAANAGWYTLPDLAEPFPYGLAGADESEADVRAWLAKPLTVLLGEDDEDPDGAALRRTPEAMRQGPHRVARGRTFFEKGKALAAQMDAPFGWDLMFVPGVAHDQAAMAAFAAPVIWG
jgi:pimeloyl-ACP methyl ester carboxylesterase